MNYYSQIYSRSPIDATIIIRGKDGVYKLEKVEKIGKIAQTGSIAPRGVRHDANFP